MLAWDRFICKTVRKHPKTQNMSVEKKEEERGRRSWNPLGKEIKFSNLKGSPHVLTLALNH